MWILYAFGSALFAGATSILAKIGIEDVDSHVATALRTIVVLIFSWLMVFIVGSQSQLVDISIKSYIFLILSGRPQEHRGYAILKHFSLVMLIRWYQ